MPPASAAAVEEDQGVPEAEGARAPAPAAPAAKAASTAVTPWRPPTWWPQPSSTCPRAVQKCHKAWGEAPGAPLTGRMEVCITSDVDHTSAG